MNKEEFLHSSTRGPFLRMFGWKGIIESLEIALVPFISCCFRIQEDIYMWTVLVKRRHKLLQHRRRCIGITDKDLTFSFL